jgi:hypothetical protein
LGEKVLTTRNVLIIIVCKEDNMNQQGMNDLGKRIASEMTVEYSGALEKNFDLAKQFIGITKAGRVDILVKDSLNGEEQVLLYLIGKLYAKEVGYTTTEEVPNKELLEELGVPEGSLLPWLKDLRDTNKIKQVKHGRYTYHLVLPNLVERTLKSVEGKIKKA